MGKTHGTLGLDRATELSGERLIGAGRLISVSAAGGHGVAIATTCAQPRLVGLEVDASFPHAIVPTTLIDDEMQANGDEGWDKAGGLSEPSGEIELSRWAGATGCRTGRLTRRTGGSW